MKTKAGLMLGALLQGALWSEATVVHFPKGSYSIRELIEGLQQETHLSIDLPFADSQNDKKNLPPQMELEEALVWILRYYERSNGLALYIERKGDVIQFQKSFGGRESEVKTLLNKRIKLVGQQWSIHQALQSAADQVGMPLDLPAEPKLVMAADYNYACSLGEWIREVRQYWMDQHGRYLSYRFGERGLSFVDAGPAPKKDLQIEILGSFSSVERIVDAKQVEASAQAQAPQRQPREATLALNSNAHNDSLAPKSREPGPLTNPLAQKDTTAPKTILPEMGPLPIAPIDRWVEPPAASDIFIHPELQLKKLAKEGPVVFLDPDARRIFLTELIRPRPMAEDPKELLPLIKEIAKPTRGFEDWCERFGKVDFSSLTVLDRKRYLRNTEEFWLESLLAGEAQRPVLKAADRGWHGAYGLEAGGGSNPQAIGDHPLRPSGASSVWLGQELALDYGINPEGPWNHSYGLRFNHVYSAGSSNDNGSLSGMGINFQSTRQLGHQGLAAISPFVFLDHTDSILTNQGSLRQNLILGGVSLHWAEAHLKGAFEKSLGVTDVYADYLQPLGNSNRHFADGRQLSQTALGLRHTQTWLKADAEGQYGPGLECSVVQRQGDHPAATGLELGTGLLWKQQKQAWAYGTGLHLNQWNRDESVTAWKIDGRLEGQLFPKGLSYTELSFENSKSSDAIMDYTATRLVLGWEIKW